jgi:hypothetical protein
VPIILESPLTPREEIIPPPNGVGALLLRFDIETSSSIRWCEPPTGMSTSRSMSPMNELRLSWLLSPPPSKNKADPECRLALLGCEVAIAVLELAAGNCQL